MGSGLHNARKLLTEDQYAPGKILSPHLSPFVLDKDAYKPGGAEILQTTMVQEDSVETNNASEKTTEEQKDMNKMMMSKKQRKLYEKLKSGQDKCLHENVKLKQRRKTTDENGKESHGHIGTI